MDIYRTGLSHPHNQADQHHRDKASLSEILNTIPSSLLERYYGKNCGFHASSDKVHIMVELVMNIGMPGPIRVELSDKQTVPMLTVRSPSAGSFIDIVQCSTPRGD